MYELTAKLCSSSAGYVLFSLSRSLSAQLAAYCSDQQISQSIVLLLLFFEVILAAGCVSLSCGSWPSNTSLFKATDCILTCVDIATHTVRYTEKATKERHLVLRLELEKRQHEVALTLKREQCDAMAASQNLGIVPETEMHQIDRSLENIAHNMSRRTSTTKVKDIFDAFALLLSTLHLLNLLASHGTVTDIFANLIGLSLYRNITVAKQKVRCSNK